MTQTHTPAQIQDESAEHRPEDEVAPSAVSPQRLCLLRLLLRLPSAVSPEIAPSEHAADPPDAPSERGIVDIVVVPCMPWEEPGAPMRIKLRNGVWASAPVNTFGETSDMVLEWLTENKECCV